MMDQQRQSQNQQQQQRSHHRRPPDVEEALSSMLWTPYERTPTDSSSDDDDERLNRKLRKSQSSYEYYQYGGLTLAPPPPNIMPYFGSSEPISPFVPLSNHHHNSIRNHNNNINNNSILSYSGSSNSINNNNINNSNSNSNNNVNNTISADYFRKTDRCDNFRFSYPYYGPIPSLKKWNLSMEPPSYDSLYSRSRDVTRVLSNLVTVSATAASGVMHTAQSGNVYESPHETYGRMVHSFTDDFVIECDSSSASSSASSTTSVQQHLYPFRNTSDISSNIAADNHSIKINDVTRLNDEQHKTKNEQKQTEVNQLDAETTTSHHRAPTILAATNSCCGDEQQQRVIAAAAAAAAATNSTTLQRRTGGNERIEDRSCTGESNEVSSLSAFVVNGLHGVADRSISLLTLTTTTTTTTATITKSHLQGLNHVGQPFDSRSHLEDPPEDNGTVATGGNCSPSNGSSGSAEECLAVAMRLNIPATIGDGANVANSGKYVSVTTSSVFLSNSIVTSNPQGSIVNNNNNGQVGSKVAILSTNNAPSLTIQVNDGCSNNINKQSSHGNFVVNQSIANNGISVVNCTYVNSGDSGSVNNSSSSNTSSSVPKNDQFCVVNSKPADIQSSKIPVPGSDSDRVTNGLPQPLSPTRTFTSTECQTDDIPIVIRDDGPAAIITSAACGGGVGGSSAFTRTHLHPDALLSREQRRRERRERRHQQQQQSQQQQQQQQQMQHQRLGRHHSHSHPPSSQPQLIHHPAHHTMSAAAAAMLRPMLPDILHSHFPPPYSALPMSQGAPPPPPPPPPPHAASLITPVISTVPIAATATMVGDGRFTIPLPIIRRSPSERSGKGCCGQWFAGPPLRALIAVVALGGVACALGGAALGATGLAGPPSSHLTAALLMIGVGVILVTVSGAAWRMTAPGGPPCLGLGSSVDLGRCGRRPCSRGGGAPHGLLYPEFQHRPPPPSYQASMQEYRLRLLLLDRDRQNGVVRGSSPPPTYRSHAGSLLRAPLTTTIRCGPGSIGGAGSEYSLPPSYRSRNNTPAIISSERSIETAPSGSLLANEDIPESSLCTNLDSSLPEYNAIISESMHQQPQQNSSSRNSQQNSATDNDNHTEERRGEKGSPTNIKMGPQKQITSSTLVDGHHSSSTPKEYSSAGDRTSLSQNNSDTDSTNPRDQLLYLSEKLNPRVLATGHKGRDNNNRTIGFLNIHSTATALSSPSSSSSSQSTDPIATTGKTKARAKDLVTIVTISAQESTNQLHMQSSPPTSHNEMEILAHL